MALAGALIPGLFDGFIADGLVAQPTKITDTLVNILGGGNYASQSSVEYALWPVSQLGSMGAPAMKANNLTTDGSGVFTIDTSGVFDPAVKLVMMVRRAQGVAGGADDDWGAGEVTVGLGP